MQTTKVFDRTTSAFLTGCRYVSSCGGTRSGKTFSILQMLFLMMYAAGKKGAPRRIVSVVSETIPHLKRGAIRDFKTILQSDGLWDAGAWSETDKTYTFENGGIIEFFSVDNAGKVYGASRDDLFVNEAQHISFEIIRQLLVRTRGQVVFDYNPTHSFWLNEKIEPRENCVRVHSTYKDNDFLTSEQVTEIESSRHDANWWKVFGLGEVGTLEGLIYDFELIEQMPPRNAEKPEAQKTDEERYADSLTEVQGLDFGFTNDPTARVQVYADTKRKHLYVRQRCYRTRMLNSDIIEDMKADGVTNRVAIYADCAEPKSIAEIERAGFNVIACDKDAPVRSDKLKFQLQWMQGWKLYVTKDSVDLIKELRNYTWAKDKDGNPMNEPIDKFNHLLDALRYAVWTKFCKAAGEGEYRFGFSKK